MASYRKRTYSPLQGRKLEAYGQIMRRERQELYASPERVAEILKNYPPELEWGRAFLQPSGALAGKPDYGRNE